MQPLAFAAVIACLLVAVHADGCVKLTNKQAVDQVTNAGILVQSRENCTEASKPRCTSLDRVCEPLIKALVKLQENLKNCTLTIIKGTEPRLHSGKALIHPSNGKSLALARRDCLDKYIMTSPRCQRVVNTHDHFLYIKCGGGINYIREKNSWNMILNNGGGSSNSTMQV